MFLSEILGKTLEPCIAKEVDYQRGWIKVEEKLKL